MNATVVNRTESRGLDSLVLSICLVVAFVLRLAVILNQPEQLTLDRDVYLALATGLVEGRGYSVPHSSVPTAFRPPVYPMCLAVGLCAFPPAIAVAGVNLLCALLTVWFTAKLGASLSLGICRFIAAFLVAVDPILVRYSAQPMTETLCTLLAVVWMWSVVARRSVSEQQPWLRGLITGLAFGLLVLCRPTFWVVPGIYLLGCVIGWMRKSHFEVKHERVLGLKRLTAAVLGTILVVAPWVVRNWLVFSVPILTTTHGGYTLLLGNNPAFYREVVRQPWGTVMSTEDQRAWEDEMKSQMMHELGPHPTEVEVDAWQSQSGRKYIAAEPAHFVEAAAHRVRSLWNFAPVGETAGANGAVITFVGWFYGVVLVAGFLGACVCVRRGAVLQWLPLYALIVVVQVVHLFYWTNTRMRAPLVPAISLFVAALVPKPRTNPNRRPGECII